MVSSSRTAAFGTCSFGRASGELLRLVVLDSFVVGEVRASRFAEAGEIFLVGLRGFVLGRVIGVMFGIVTAFVAGSQFVIRV